MKKILFLRIGWMKDYRGLQGGNDPIIGGGSHVTTHGHGAEIYNFLPLGDVYLRGFVQPTRGSIRIEKLGASKSDDRVEGVLVVWVARKPESAGTLVVGWYKNATVFRSIQEPYDQNFRYPDKDKEPGRYNVKAKSEEFCLLPVEHRSREVPKGKHGMGQSQVCFAHNESMVAFSRKVIQHIKDCENDNRSRERILGRRGRRSQSDQKKMEEVEEAAQNATKKHYEELGYAVSDVHKKNKGWDLEAKLGRAILQLEAKGLSGKNVAVELTSNEYEQMSSKRATYKVCILTQALKEASELRTCSFNSDTGEWVTDRGEKLRIEPPKGARLTLA